jgi:thiol-disulfide isomerase/thioredoxin
MTCCATQPSKAAMSRLGRLCILGLALHAMSCTTATQTNSPSLYVATFATDPATEILVAHEGGTWVVRNGEERVTLIQRDENTYEVPVFQGSWVGAWEKDVWKGVWTDSLRPNNYRVPLEIRPLPAQTTSTTLKPETSAWDTSEGLLMLRSRGDSVWATMSTPVGDYRFLSGKIDGKKLVFSNFDGSHLFRFEATMRGDSLVAGSFLSGTHYQTTFEGVKRPSPHITWHSATQNPVSDECQIQGVLPSGKEDVWTIERLLSEGKTGLVVDIMGTWCPNCMDETRLLQSLHAENPGVQFLSLAFERQTDSLALRRIDSFQRHMGLEWPILLGGRANKKEAAAALSFLDTLHSFPTTVFWPVEGDPVIHKGFNGPATGEGYDVEISFFRSQLARLNGRSENH